MRHDLYETDRVLLVLEGVTLLLTGEPVLEKSCLSAVPPGYNQEIHAEARDNPYIMWRIYSYRQYSCKSGKAKGIKIT